MLPAIRVTCLFSLPSTIRPILATRLYATHTGLGTTSSPSQPRRKAVTTFNDDGRVAWKDLSSRERVARTTQQTFNLGTVLVGAILTVRTHAKMSHWKPFTFTFAKRAHTDISSQGGVIYLLYTEVFSPESKISYFNRAADQVKNDPRCTEILGNSKKIRAYGEPTSSKWARAGPIASNITKDKRGVEHLVMHFNVEGPLNKGVVNLHMVKHPSDSEFFYRYLFLDVKGHSRIYLENADASADSPGKNKSKLFGISWR
ncbi:Mitochondrial import inner membrane translocase subunit tim21 protein [Rutstroemia sp. NJR-2017a WRK4]|nr:Mitochondrial import inner membrane translocase subunit tim21 protein [Rutstroemia sp. NJR-2017a WRK4]